MIGLYNMSLYSTTSGILEAEEADLSTKQFINCSVISSKTACIRNNNDESISDILFVLILLLTPNLIVFSYKHSNDYFWFNCNIFATFCFIFSSYSWICYHVYSNSIKFKKSVAAILVKKHRNKMVNKETSNITNQCKQTQEADLKEKTSLVPIIDEITKYGSNTAIKKGRLNIYKNSTQLITSNILNANSQISINKRNKSVILTTCLMVICFTLCW